jgi:hypothetical protein
MMTVKQLVITKESAPKPRGKMKTAFQIIEIAKDSAQYR